MPESNGVFTSSRSSSSKPRSCSALASLRPRTITPPGCTSAISARVSASSSVPGSPMKRNCPTCCSRGSEKRFSGNIDVESLAYDLFNLWFNKQPMPREITDRGRVVEAVQNVSLTAELFEEQNGKQKYATDLEVIVQGRDYGNGKRVGPYVRLLAYDSGEHIMPPGESGGNTRAEEH